jgi:hypothetical protein
MREYTKSLHTRKLSVDSGIIQHGSLLFQKSIGKRMAWMNDYRWYWKPDRSRDLRARPEQFLYTDNPPDLRRQTLAGSLKKDDKLFEMSKEITTQVRDFGISKEKAEGKRRSDGTSVSQRGDSSTSIQPRSISSSYSPSSVAGLMSRASSLKTDQPDSLARGPSRPIQTVTFANTISNQSSAKPQVDMKNWKSPYVEDESEPGSNPSAASSPSANHRGGLNTFARPKVPSKLHPIQPHEVNERPTLQPQIPPARGAPLPRGEAASAPRSTERRSPELQRNDPATRLNSSRSSSESPLPQIPLPPRIQLPPERPPPPQTPLPRPSSPPSSPPSRRPPREFSRARSDSDSNSSPGTVIPLTRRRSFTRSPSPPSQPHPSSPLAPSPSPPTSSRAYNPPPRGQPVSSDNPPPPRPLRPTPLQPQALRSTSRKFYLCSLSP